VVHDPLAVFYTTVGCLDYYLIREDDRAIKDCRKLEMDPNFARAHSNLVVYKHKRMHDQSFHELETAITLEGVDPK